jgi:hypothetical protein
VTILLVSRWEFDVVWSRIPQERMKQIAGLHTPHIWLAVANALVIIKDEVEIGKYRHEGTGCPDPSLSSMQTQVLCRTFDLVGE